MATLLTLDIPLLEPSGDPVTLCPSVSPPLSLCLRRRVFSCGLALQQCASLASRLTAESHRRHADPNDLAAMDTEGDGVDTNRLDASSHPSSNAFTSARRRRVVKLTDEDVLVDWYEVLCLPSGEGSTEEHIRAAYRRRCLETHPDKQSDRSDAAFKRVQRAFDILGDPDTRLAYDSSRPFDDSIPGEGVAEADFYTTFAPVFERNRRWSMEADLPSLGGDAMGVREVHRFYERWMHFRSWRDFSHLVEIEEIDDSMSREERRFYTRENERQVQHLRREEQRRVRLLVQRARQGDPRLRRSREAAEAQRVADAAAREAQRELWRAEEQHRRAAVAAAAEETRLEAQRRLVEEKSAIRAAQARMLAHLAEANVLDETPAQKLLSDAVRRPNVVWLFAKVQTASEAEDILARVSAAGMEPKRVKRTPSATHHTQTNKSQNHGGGHAGKKKGQGHPQQKEDEEAKEEEVVEVEAVLCFNAILEQKEQEIGLTRYGEPIKRAPKTTEGVNPTATTEASEDTSTAGASRKKTHPPSTSANWDEEDLVRLQKATAKYPPGSMDRWSKIAGMLRGKFTEEEAMAKVNALTAALNQGSPGGGIGAKQPHPNVLSSNNHNNNNNNSNSSTEAAGGTPNATAAATVLVEEWTMRQQKQLEQGLRDLKDYKEKDKFQKIAAMVEGKTAKECFDRFKYLCSVNKRK